MPIRIALFGSHYYGYSLLENLLDLRKRFPEIELVGVASDDPSKPWVSPQKRLWQYKHSNQEEEMVADLAKREGLPVWRGRVKDDGFREEFLKRWSPDLCYMSVFGQRIPEHIWNYPLFGFYNFHSCAGETWPSNVGAQAFESMAADGEKRGAVAMHQIDNEFDHGPLIAFSPFFSFDEKDGVMHTFKKTSPHVGKLMAWHLQTLLGVDVPTEELPRVIAGKAHELKEIAL